jgi:hypothetical protein
MERRRYAPRNQVQGFENLSFRHGQSVALQWRFVKIVVDSDRETETDFVPDGPVQIRKEFRDLARTRNFPVAGRV